MAEGGPLARIRAYYADLVAGSGDPSVRNAFATVSRERFLGPGPWLVVRNPAAGYVRTPSADPVFIYQDILVALKPDAGLNNGQPSLHAFALSALKVAAGETVLHLGCGTGYYTAILAELTSSSGRVLALDIEPDLAELARENLEPWKQVQVATASATDGALPEADAIYVSAGATTVPRPWVDALRPGGRLLFPLLGDDGWGCMLLVTRSGSGHAARFIGRAGFVACHGAQDATDSVAVGLAFRRDGGHPVRSLRLDIEPDATCWAAGRDWWLSTDSVT